MTEYVQYMHTRPFIHTHMGFPHVHKLYDAITHCHNKKIILRRQHIAVMIMWRNGSVSDSRSEGCMFKSCRDHNLFFFYFLPIPTPCKLMNTLIHLVLNPQYWTICTVYSMKNYFKDWKEVRILRRKVSQNTISIIQGDVTRLKFHGENLIVWPFNCKIRESLTFSLKSSPLYGT